VVEGPIHTRPIGRSGQKRTEARTRRGTETPLRHGSGIGLWIVKWGIDHLGGRISFAEREPQGTTVTVAVSVDRTE